MTPKILLVYASKYGQTAKISRSMAQVIESLGLQADVRDIVKIGDISPAGYAGVLVGTPIYAGKTNRAIKKWILHHCQELNEIATGFFTVSLNAADKRPTAREAERRIFRDFQNDTNWHPDMYATFIGTLNYLEYNPILRFFLKRISASAGGPTDTSKDHELTDWQAVDSFTRNFCSSLISPLSVKVPRPERTLEF